MTGQTLIAEPGERMLLAVAAVPEGSKVVEYFMRVGLNQRVQPDGNAFEKAA